jgi:hypothetical protein
MDIAGARQTQTHRLLSDTRIRLWRQPHGNHVRAGGVGIRASSRQARPHQGWVRGGVSALTGRGPGEERSGSPWRGGFDFDCRKAIEIEIEIKSTSRYPSSAYVMDNSRVNKGRNFYSQKYFRFQSIVAP